MTMGPWDKWALVLATGGLALGCTVSTGDPDSDSGGAAGEGGSMSGGTGGSGGSSGNGASGGTGGTGGSGGSGGTVPDPVDDILSNPAVQSALEEASEQGIDISTHTENDAPDPSGYYDFEHHVGTWVASGNGANVGFVTTAAEMRLDVKPDGTLDMATVSAFDGVTPSSFGVSHGYLLRGAGNELTLYGHRVLDCDLGGSSFSVTGEFIWTGTLEEGTGNWVDQQQFAVTTATEGELTPECEEGLVGNTEVVGGWAVAIVPVATKVTVEDLDLMCVDGDRGYIPTEEWTGEGGAACECTPELAVSCES